MQLSIPRILISGTSPGAGKTLFGVGLTVALMKRKVGVSSAVLGSKFQEATLYGRLSRRFAHIFDRNIINDAQLFDILYMAGVGADLVIFEGKNGLYDGESGGSLWGSDADFAAVTGTPVVLVADVCKYGMSFAAVVRGFRELAKNFQLKGIIANRLSHKKPGYHKRCDRDFYNASLALFNEPGLLGGIEEKESETLPRGETSLFENGPQTVSRQFLIGLGDLIERSVDIDQLLSYGESATDILYEGLFQNPTGRRVRIAVAIDSCFGHCYQDNFDYLRYYGAEVVPFSPLADVDLPDNIGGLYLTGANLSEYALDISRNEAIKNAIRQFYHSGGAIYSEGAGTVYLANEFEAPSVEKCHEGVGILDASFKGKEGKFDYIENIIIEDSILGSRGSQLKGVYTNEWQVTKAASNIPSVFQMSGVRANKINEGFSPGPQIICTLGFNHFGASPECAKAFVDASQVCKSL